MSGTLDAQIGERTDLLQLREQALREGMMPLRIAGCLKVAAGLTSIEEVISVAPPPRREGPPTS